MRFISIEFQEECINHLRAIFANSLQNCFQSKTNFALMHTSASVVGLYYTTYCPSNPCIYISTVEMPSFAGSKAYTKAYFKSNITKMEPRLCVHCRKQKDKRLCLHSELMLEFLIIYDTIKYSTMKYRGIDRNNKGFR